MPDQFPPLCRRLRTEMAAALATFMMVTTTAPNSLVRAVRLLHICCFGQPQMSQSGSQWLGSCMADCVVCHLMCLEAYEETMLAKGNGNAKMDRAALRQQCICWI
jgi:hypothetical protein